MQYLRNVIQIAIFVEKIIKIQGKNSVFGEKIYILIIGRAKIRPLDSLFVLKKITEGGSNKKQIKSNIYMFFLTQNFKIISERKV